MADHRRGGAAPIRSEPPFRADHVGSLLRPRRLLDARAAHAEGRIDDAELRAVEDDAILEAMLKVSDRVSDLNFSVGRPPP